MRRFGIEDLTRLVVVHDELDLPLGGLQVKAGGGLAGHNGLRSIKAHLHTDAFTRVRIGIGKPPGGKERGADHVLRRAVASGTAPSWPSASSWPPMPSRPSSPRAWPAAQNRFNRDGPSVEVVGPSGGGCHSHPVHWRPHG